MDYARPLVKGSGEESLIAIATAFGLEFASCRGRRCRSGYQNTGVEANSSVMKSPISIARRRVRVMARGLASLAGWVLLLTCLSSRSKLGGTIASADQGSTTSTGYVGSGACSKCHPSIYESFSRTDMGRSMSEITPALLESIPTSASLFDPGLNRHFEISLRDNHLYQSEYETTADGKDVFRETRKLEWMIG